MDKSATFVDGRQMEEPKLDRELIVQVALQMMQNEGIDSFSMRKLGARLNVRAPTLYWYFPDRSSIVREVIKTLLVATVDRISPTERWQDWLRSFGLELWKTNREAPYVSMILQSAEFNDQKIFEMAVNLLDERSRHFGMDKIDFMRIHSDIQALVLGWAVFLHAGVVNRVEGFFDVDTAVNEAVTAIIKGWDAKIEAR